MLGRLGRARLGALLLLAAASVWAQNVGSSTCAFCHAEVSASFTRNPHAQLPAEEACESCHGPGAMHAGSGSPTDIRNPGKLPVADSDKICLSCHRNEPGRAGRLENGHATNQVACVTCHPMHKPNEPVAARAPAAVNAQCGGCHTAVRAAFARPFTHKLLEGAMSCTDCHDPHNRNLTATKRMVAAAGQPSCFNCHGEKRGPFVFEHAPMRTDGCSACHEPHGSANPRMLIANQQRVVCLQCHANLGLAAPGLEPGLAPVLGGTPPASHDLASGRYQQCSVCHISVHGSNVSRQLLR